VVDFTNALRKRALIPRGEHVTEDKIGTLDGKQLDRLTRYFEEAVMSSRKYKIA
jgi:hypothetical protein